MVIGGSFAFFKADRACGAGGQAVAQAVAVILAQQPRLAKKVVHLPDMLSADDFAMVVAKDRPELAAELNAALKALKENGEFDKLMMKWFGKAK